MSDTKADDTETIPFASWLMQQANGKTETELTDGMRDLVNRVIDTGKKGSITLVVYIEPMKEDDSMVVVKDEIKLRLPEHDRKPSIFWTDNGNLVRSDPNQTNIFDHLTGRTVNAKTGEV